MTTAIGERRECICLLSIEMLAHMALQNYGGIWLRPKIHGRFSKESGKACLQALNELYWYNI